MSDKYSTSSDYVDIHGRSLNVLIKSDGSIFVPLPEIRKTGYHIFPKADYQRAVGKTMIFDEFRLYLLGAAREFLIQRDLRGINNDDIYKTIEECHAKLMSNGSTPANDISPAGVLGRRLLLDPAELRKSKMYFNQPTLPPPNKSENFGGMHQNNKANNFSRSDLRLPHAQNDNFKQTNSDFVDSYKKPSHLTTSNRHEQNKNAKNSRANSDSRSTSENEEGQQYVKIPDLKLERIQLQPDIKEVKVVYIESKNEKLKYWVQLVENNDIVDDVMMKCYEMSGDARVVKPKLNKCYLAMNKEDELWYRVIVLRVNPVLVHFLDFGNDAVVSEVRNLPDELKSIPAQAVRIILSRPEGSNAEKLEMKEILSVKYIKQYEDSTILVQRAKNKTNTDKLQKPSEPIIVDKIKYSKEWVDKDFVKIIAHCDGKLYLRNKEHHSKLVEVDMEIKNWKREVVKNVVSGQLVLCKKEGSEEKLCRARVEKVENTQVTVHFIDYHKNDKVSINNLYCANRIIANLPATLIESPPFKGYSTSKFDDKASSKLEEMIKNNAKFTVAASGPEFDLFMGGKPLSEMIYPDTCKSLSTQQLNNSRTSSKVQDVAKNSDDKDTRVMFEDMKSYEAPMGIADYMVTNFKDATDITVTSTEDEESDLLSRCTCIEVTDTVPYEPEESEMILAHFEGGWYRATVFEKSESGIYQVLFVEYGNILELTKDEIRRFPKEFKDIPMLGLSCRLQVKNSEKVRQRLEKLLEPDNIYEINFISYSIDSMQYTVDVPKITEILKQEGLM